MKDGATAPVPSPLDAPEPPLPDPLFVPPLPPLVLTVLPLVVPLVLTAVASFLSPAVTDDGGSPVSISRVAALTLPRPCLFFPYGLLSITVQIADKVLLPLGRLLLYNNKRSFNNGKHMFRYISYP